MCYYLLIKIKGSIRHADFLFECAFLFKTDQIIRHSALSFINISSAGVAVQNLIRQKMILKIISCGIIDRVYTVRLPMINCCVCEYV